MCNIIVTSMYIYIYICVYYNEILQKIVTTPGGPPDAPPPPVICPISIVAIFYPFSQFCIINISLLSLQKRAKHSPKSISEGGRIWQV